MSLINKDKCGYHKENCNCFYIPSDREKKKWLGNKLKYYKSVRKKQYINLLIVGNVPYENEYNGIAFCKDLWKDFLDAQCSGRYLLCSLGINLNDVQKKYTPLKLFMQMAKKGIVFVNQGDVLLRQCLSRNVGQAVSCGSNIQEKVKKEIQGEVELFKHIDRHPCPQGETNPPDKSGDWYKFWGTYESLLRILEPSGSGPIHDAVSDINA